MSKIGRKLLAILLALTMTAVSFAPCRVTVYAASSEESGGESEAEENPGTGKYVREVFIAYGKSEKDAVAWLEKNGWEPIKGDAKDFCAGKNSKFDNAIAAVMGIRRTDDKNDAITDMAVMNMKGGYSFEDYESLVEEKETEINAFIDTFIPVLEEYRENYNRTDDSFGKKRADLAYDILNKFYDGSRKERYAVNDTGEYLGTLFLTETKRELEVNGESYKALPREEQLQHADLTQIILESSGPAMLAVEQMLALGADSNDDTWLERLAGLTGEDLKKNLPRYAPEAAGQNVSASSAINYLKSHFGDTARMLASQWIDVNTEMLWYEGYCSDNGLWPEDDEPEEDYNNRVSAYFSELENSDEELYEEAYDRFYDNAVLYDSLYEIEYEGEWGGTLGDFFNPADETNYGLVTDYFLPFAAALSEGQRAASNLLSLRSLLLMGFADEKGFDHALPNLEEIFKDADELSVYTGINRGIFRNGVALTSEALMEQSMGRGRAFDQLWDNAGIMAITSYVSAIVGLSSFVAGAVMAVKGYTKYLVNTNMPGYKALVKGIEECDKMIAESKYAINHGMDVTTELDEWVAAKARAQAKIDQEYTVTELNKVGVGGRIMMGVGGALMIYAAVMKAVQLSKYYDREFTPIPLMIVDESDIVTYVKDKDGNTVYDENGKPKKKIDFNQYEYYDAVRCNRDKDNKLSDWQDGVKEYFDERCGDVADLNGDFGQEWLALYTVKSASKGDPILADSLTLQYGNNSQPEGTTKCLHLFTYTHAVDLGDTAWSFNNKKGGVYFFWDEDKGAFAEAAASAFSAGQMAMASGAGLLAGILGSTLVLLPKRKKKENAAA